MHLVREVAPAIENSDIREALSYQQHPLDFFETTCVHCADAASSFSTRSKPSIVSRSVELLLDVIRVALVSSVANGGTGGSLPVRTGRRPFSSGLE